MVKCFKTQSIVRLAALLFGVYASLILNFNITGMQVQERKITIV